MEPKQKFEQDIETILSSEINEKNSADVIFIDNRIINCERCKMEYEFGNLYFNKWIFIYLFSNIYKQRI